MPVNLELCVFESEEEEEIPNLERISLDYSIIQGFYAWIFESEIRVFDLEQDGEVAVKVFQHGGFEQNHDSLIIDYARQISNNRFTKSPLQLELEWELLMEGGKHPVFVKAFRFIADDIERRLKIFGKPFADHMRAITNGTRPGKLDNIFGLFSMAYCTKLLEMPHSYSGDNVYQIINSLTAMNGLQNSVSRKENGNRTAPSPTGKFSLEAWLNRTAYEEYETEPDQLVCPLLIEEFDEENKHYFLGLDRENRTSNGQVLALSFSYGIEYEDAIVHIDGQSKLFRLPTSLRRTCRAAVEHGVALIWTDVFNDPYFRHRLGASMEGWGEALCGVYKTNPTFKAGWNCREISYFNRGWILQEFLHGKPSVAPVFHECQGGIAAYEARTRALDPIGKLVWVTCWSALLWFMNGLTNPQDAGEAFSGLMDHSSKEHESYCREVLERIRKKWRAGSGGGFRTIRDALLWVGDVLGAEKFARYSLMADRMLCEATMLLMTCVISLANFDDQRSSMTELMLTFWKSQIFRMSGRVPSIDDVEKYANRVLGEPARKSPCRPLTAEEEERLQVLQQQCEGAAGAIAARK